MKSGYSKRNHQSLQDRVPLPGARRINPVQPDQRGFLKW